jgi:hypothetical protein
VDESPPGNRIGPILAVAALLGVLVAIVALLDIGPFADDELTVEEFIDQGDEICSQAHDEFLDLQDGVVPRTPGDAAELTGALIEVAEEERDAIADLREPESLSGQVERYLEVRDRGIEILKDGRAAAESANPSEYERLQAELAATQIDPRFEIAGEIGFEECSRPLVERDELRRQAEEPTAADPSAPPTVNNPPTGTP